MPGSGPGAGGDGGDGGKCWCVGPALACSTGAGMGFATRGKSSLRMNSSNDSTRFSALSARSSTRLRRASIRSNGSLLVSIPVFVALALAGTDFFCGGDLVSYGWVRFRGRPRVLVRSEERRVGKED